MRNPNSRSPLNSNIDRYIYIYIYIKVSKPSRVPQPK